MKRRQFFSSLAALATTAALPTVPAIYIGGRVEIVYKLAMNAMYGKFGVGADYRPTAWPT